MASHLVSAASGEGHEALDPGGGVQVHLVEVHVLTVHPKSRLIGTGAIPRGIWQIGQVGLGYFTDDPNPNGYDILFEPHSIHQEREGWYIPSHQEGISYYSSVWWRLNSGVTANIEVFW